MLVDRHVVPRMLTRAERRRPVRNAVVRDVLDTAAEQTTWEAKSAAFDRAMAALRDEEDEDERGRLVALVLDALDFGIE